MVSAATFADDEQGLPGTPNDRHGLAHRRRVCHANGRGQAARLVPGNKDPVNSEKFK